MTAHPSEYDDAMLGNIILHGECPECDGKFMAAPTYLEFLPQGVDPETGEEVEAEEIRVRLTCRSCGEFISIPVPPHLGVELFEWGVPTEMMFEAVVALMAEDIHT